ncbi:hypothetical protein ACQP1U_09490 [Actinomycetota bacterium]
MTQLVGALRSALGVVGYAARLLARHWPGLVLIYLLGAAAHNGLLWAAVAISSWSPFLAGLVLPLVPIATLTALILALRHLSPHLPAVHRGMLAGEDPGGLVGSPTRRRLALLASTLIPFLTVYTSQGYLREDGQAFVNAAVTDEFNSGFSFWTMDIDTNRTVMATGWAFAAIVLVAFALRTLLDRLELPSKALGWGLLAGYLEVFWVFLLAKTFSGYQDQVWAWVRERRFSQWCLDTWGAVVEMLGPVGQPVDRAVQWFWGALGEADAIIVIPVAWLTVGAVVYGQRLVSPEREPVERPWARAATRVPAPVRRAGAEATESVRSRFSALVDGLRLLAVAGLGPMLLFCLVFLLARQVEYAAQELMRLAVGPQDANTALAFAPHRNMIARGFYTVVLVALLGAAIDRILGGSQAVGESSKNAASGGVNHTTSVAGEADSGIET